MINTFKLPLVVFLVFLSCRTSATQIEAPAIENLNNGGRAKDWTFGHLLNQTAYTFGARDCTVGYVVVACGATDSITLGFSPWLVHFYNMSNVFVRKKLEDSSLQQTSIQLGYFKTFSIGIELPSYVAEAPPEDQDGYCFNNCYQGYKMHAFWLYWLKSQAQKPGIFFHWNVQLAYYWDDSKSFSLRRPQTVKNPVQFNITSMYEIAVSETVYVQSEWSLLGLQSKFPALHSGLSISKRKNNYTFQFGASATGFIGAWFGTDRRDYHHYLLSNSVNGLNREFTSDVVSRDFSVHPEILAQYNF